MNAETSFYKGNTNTDGKDHRGWFIGPFMNSTDPMAKTDGLEVKMTLRKAGDIKESQGGTACTSLALLVSGEFELRFENGLYRLSHEGDYLLWRPNLPHQTLALKDSCIVTIRWF